MQPRSKKAKTYPTILLEFVSAATAWYLPQPYDFLLAQSPEELPSTAGFSLAVHLSEQFARHKNNF